MSHMSTEKTFPSDHNCRRIKFIAPSTLEVEYAGGTYQYKNVPEELFQQALAAESIGKFLSAEIKNKFDYVKVKVK